MTTCSDKTCCILIGSTGCGKSTIIENMCINDGSIKSGNSDTSVTKMISVVKHKTNNNLLFMDTIGCEDTDNKMTDDEILKEITHKLANSGAPKIKVIWCTKPEDRKIPKLQKQAKFINSLVTGNWGAVQIIIKKGIDTSDSNGPQGAAKDYTQHEIPTFDLHCLDRIENINDNKLYKYASKSPLKERLEDGFIYSKEMDDIISKKISNLRSATADLKKEFYHDKNCRLISKMIHSGQIIVCYSHKGHINRRYEHDGRIKIENLSGHTNYCESTKKLKKKHLGRIQTTWNHTGYETTTYKHKGYLQTTWKHKGTLKKVYDHDGYVDPIYKHKGTSERYYTGSTTRCPYGHSSSEIASCTYRSGSWVSYWDCYDCGANIRVGDSFYHCYSCCNRGGRSGHTSIVIKCSGMFCTSCGKQTTHNYSYRYSGCHCSINSNGCYLEKKWSCCGRSPSSTCSNFKMEWSCCDRSAYESKCRSFEKKWTQCGCDGSERGCISDAKMSCCGRSKSSRCNKSVTKWSQCGCKPNDAECCSDGYEYSCGKDRCRIKKSYSGCGCLEGNEPTTSCSLVEQKWSCCNRNKNNKECLSNKGKDVSYYSGCGHLKNDKNYCKEDYKYWNGCNIKQNETLKKICGNGGWKYVPKNFA